MPEMSSRWEPDRDPIHRLIQFLDAMAIAFNRFRQRSFHLPSHNPPQPFDSEGWHAGRNLLSKEFDAVRGAIFSGYAAPMHRAERLVDEAVAAFVRAGEKDDTTVAAVTSAAQWLAAVGTPWVAGEPRPWDYYVPHRRSGQRFEQEGLLLNQYTLIRRGLLAALTRIGQTVPEEIDRRASLAHHTWAPDGSDPITQDQLLALIRAAEPNAPAQPTGPAEINGFLRGQQQQTNPLPHVTPSDPPTEPVASFLADREADVKREELKEKGLRIGSRRTELFHVIVADPFDAQVGDWCDGWKAFAVALRKGESGATEIRRLGAMVACWQALWEKWIRAHRDWYAKEATPWHAETAGLRLGRFDEKPLVRYPESDCWQARLPQIWPDAGPAKLLNEIINFGLLQQAEGADRTGLPTDLKAVYISLSRLDAAEKVLPHLKNRERVANVALTIGAALLPAPDVIRAFLETQPSSEAVQDAKYVLRLTPDEIYKPVTAELDKQRNERECTSAGAPPTTRPREEDTLEPALALKVLAGAEQDQEEAQRESRTRGVPLAEPASGSLPVGVGKGKRSQDYYPPAGAPHAVTGQGNGDNAEPDGPFGAAGFRFAGVEVEFGRAVRQLRLVMALWDAVANGPSAPRTIEEVMTEVYGEGHETEDATFRQLCSDTRGRLQRKHCPLDIRSVQGRVQLIRV